MLKKDNRTRLLEVFFDNPLPEGTGFQLRELSRKIKLAPVSVKKYLKELEKENLILIKKHRIHNYPLYFANRDNNYFKLLKKLNTIQLINEEGLLDYLKDECMPQVIVLFGSASKGEDIKESDLDLFIQSDKINLDLKKFENKMGRTINIFFESDFSKISNELKNNIINGSILYGYLEVL